MDLPKKQLVPPSYDLSIWMSWLLRAGVFICGLLIALGWFFMLIQQTPPAGASGQTPVEILIRIKSGDFTAFVPLGIRLLILLPVLRVALSLILFVVKKDKIYVVLSTTVLAILLASLSYGFSTGG